MKVYIINKRRVRRRHCFALWTQCTVSPSPHIVKRHYHDKVYSWKSILLLPLEKSVCLFAWDKCSVKQVNITIYIHFRTGMNAKSERFRLEFHIVLLKKQHSHFTIVKRICGVYDNIARYTHLFVPSFLTFRLMDAIWNVALSFASRTTSTDAQLSAPRRLTIDDV